MRSAALPSILLTCALVLGAGGSVAAAAARDGRAQPRLHAQLESCTAGLESADRVAVFAGSMPRRAAAMRMGMRFVLQRRTGARGRWGTVAVPGFGTWERSEPDRAGFVFHKRVAGLAVGPTVRYRARVSFRWEDRDGDVVARARRSTLSCRQPDLRPDLVPGALTAAPGPIAGSLRYMLVVRNAGRRAAGPFTVAVAGVPVEVSGLAARASTAVQLFADACAPGGSVVVAVDPDGLIDEAREDHGAATRPCPVTGA